MSQKLEPVPEFSRLIPRERLGARVVDREISATPQERAALARRFRLVGFDLLRATATIGPVDGPGDKTTGQEAAGLLRLSGHLSAELSQACVVTLEPVTSRIEENFTQLYSLDLPAPRDANGDATGGAEVVVDPETEAPPEPLGPEGLDLGEVVAQQLAMALDPYPRAPGATLEAVPGATAAAGRGFAVLEALKRHE